MTHLKTSYFKFVLTTIGLILFFSVRSQTLYIQIKQKTIPYDSVWMNEQVRTISKLSYSNQDSAILLSNQILENVFTKPEQEIDIHLIPSINSNSNSLHFLIHKGIIYNSIGVSYDILSKPNLALEYYQKALLTWEAFDKNPFTKSNSTILKQKSKTFGNLGIVYDNKSEYEKAETFYLKAYHLALETNNEIDAAYVLINLGSLYYQKNDIEKGLQYLNEALMLTEKLSLYNQKSIVLNNIATIFIELDKYDEALEHFLQGLEIDQSLNSVTSIAIKMGNIGYLYTQKKEFQLAEKYLLEAEQMSDSLENIFLQLDHHRFLYELYETTQQFHKAYPHFKKHIELRDSINSEDNIKEQANIEANYTIEKIKFEQELHQQKRELEIQNEREKQQTLFWFTTGILSLVILLILLFLNNLKNAKKRTKLESEKKQLEVEYKLLRTQMNPHFIFNALNSVNAYIMQDHSEKASQLLSKFSKLIRTILAHSTKDKLYLKEEIDLIKEYIEIEQIRFSNKFQYKIIVHSDINEEILLIPTMILQPFVENAILHGLAPLENNDGLITIEIAHHNVSKLQITISDNGVGRKASSSKNLHKNHESLATQLIEERLTLLNGSHFESIRYEDLENGTKVIVILPFESEFD